MEIVIEFARWLLPSIMVFASVLLVFNGIKKSDTRRYSYELRLKERRTVMPIRLQAHERMIIFLERITPEALIMRLQRPTLTVQELHSAMLKTIRQEWDHNVSQQLYITDRAWELIRLSRENVVKLINTEAGKLKPNEAAMKLSQSILEECSGNKLPTTDAIQTLKADIHQIL